MINKPNPDACATVTCEGCGKTNGTGQAGTHWICEDCRVNEPVKPTAKDGTKQDS